MDNFKVNQMVIVFDATTFHLALDSGGDGEAMQHVGRAYMTGVGVPVAEQNDKLAVEWFVKAAEQV